MDQKRTGSSFLSPMSGGGGRTESTGGRSRAVETASKSETVRQPTTVDVGPERQLFLDDFLLDRLENVTRSVNQPTTHAENPIFVTEKPWEGKRLLYCNVELNEEDGTHTLWYNVSQPTGENLLCYATSRDGLHFERPDLGLVDFDGNRRNNIVVLPHGGAVEARVFRDPHDPNPSQRYKMVYLKSGSWGINVAWSPDGLRWTGYERNPVLAPAGDALSTPFWDHRYGRYVYYLRPNGRHVMRSAGAGDPSAFPTRRIGRAESFRYVDGSWTDIQEVFSPDERDGPGTEFYYMPVLQYQGCYLGLLIVFHEYTGDPDPIAGFNLTLDTQLAFSRDGKRWQRVCDRQTFLGGTPGQWDEKRVYPECAIVKADEIWLYYRGSNIPHRNINDSVGKVIDGRRMTGDALGLARVRLDGFVSLDAGELEGSATTWPLRFAGRGELQVNADASRGTLRVEALNVFGAPIPGFTIGECIPIRRDVIRHKVEWAGGSSLTEINQPARLRFTMRNTKLFSFQIA